MPFRYQLFLLIHFTIHRTACGGNFQASDFVSHGRFAFFFFFAQTFTLLSRSLHWIPTLVLQCLIGLVCISLTFYPHIKLFGSGYPGPNCFRTIQISYNGKTATATIQDEVGFVCLLTTPVSYHTPSTVPGMSFRWSRYDYGALRLLCRSECWCHLCHLVLCRRQQWRQRW